VLNKIKGILYRFSIIRLPYKALRSIRKTGIKATVFQIRLYLKKRIYFFKTVADSLHLPYDNRIFQEKFQFNKNIKISIIVPLYNTPKNYLNEMIASVLFQTYVNWELCIADGSDNGFKYIGEICKGSANKDKRIKYIKLKENGGISYNTNKAIELSDGDYIAMLDHDDLLHPSALYEVMHTICKYGADLIYTDEIIFKKKSGKFLEVYYKQDFAPDTLRSQNYMTHFCVYSRNLFNSVGPYNKQFDGSQDYDLILRMTEKARTVKHIPKTLYYWRSHKNSVVGDITIKYYAINAAKHAINEHLKRIGLTGNAIDSEIMGMYKIQYDLKEPPLISIIIPNKDSLLYLKKCIETILMLTTYTNYEIIIVENNSEMNETFIYYEQIIQNHKIKVVTWEGAFNFSSICNYGAKYALGEHYLFLNNDIEVITGKWLDEMIMYIQRKDVGAVGAKLLYEDGTIQHAGVVLGIGGVAGHSHKGFPRESLGYMGRLKIVQNVSAVTGACMLIKSCLFNELNGFDENLAVAFNDIDLCMRIREKEFLIVFTPYAELYHYESKSRGYEDTPEKQKRFEKEVNYFQSRWKEKLLAGDPYYNPNLTLTSEDFSPLINIKEQS
jgi:glycosyltransferase involved in cell wall biosynthesis